MLHRQQVFLGMLMTTALLLPARAQDEKKEWIHPEAVSYTHLTLPTKA